ncbi:hypothetical protein SAMN05216215_103161 [Saccharopolyspora shandongensis]|uniref:Uncharacterized protein n=1 Tax=Saccharopolyspora shandongensis TaxID=418495 RepID=A0A1H3LHP7_9PSEU|nr:hypothetical protein [Saccharopolyspora shandongensis]SDY63488.1 hypothetical protein SAMN05216215_103161 [Saccharopolyspora shandongensis]
MHTPTTTTITETEYAFGPRRAPRSVHGIAEPTPIPGLVVTPQIEPDYRTGQWRFTGGWCVRHATSGVLVLACRGAGLGHAREAVELLARGWVNWTRPAEVLSADPLALDVQRETSRHVGAAIREDRPVLLHTTSWRQVPPPWLVDITHADGEWIESYYCPSYDSAERLTIELGRDLGLLAGVRKEVTISRLPDPLWELHCARRGCDSVLLDDEYEEPEHDADRQVLVTVAEGQRWRQLDARRLLCRTCNPLFRGATPDGICPECDSQGTPNGCALCRLVDGSD